MMSKKDNLRLFKIWQGMRQRCNNPKDKDYPSYGGRGIRICKEWNRSASFMEWAINNGYSDDLTIDRIDVNGNYEPSNCRWATYTQQARNKRMQKNNSVGFSGIYYEKERKKYRATIYVNNKKVDLGRYESLEEAIKARKNGEIRYWGVGA